MSRTGNNIPMTCPNCKSEWFDQYSQPNPGGQIAGLVERFKSLKQILIGDNPATRGFGLTFEIAESVPVKPEQ
jgi:hypothetical protein